MFEGIVSGVVRGLGRELFDEFAFDYLQRYPSKSYTLSRLGDRFADFLEETRPDRVEGEGQPAVDWPDFLIDLCALEWTIEQVFDGPGVEGKRLLTAEDLRGMNAEAFAGARLQTVVCLQLMEFKYPVNDYYTAARRTKRETKRRSARSGRAVPGADPAGLCGAADGAGGGEYTLLASLQRGDGG